MITDNDLERERARAWDCPYDKIAGFFNPSRACGDNSCCQMRGSQPKKCRIFGPCIAHHWII